MKRIMKIFGIVLVTLALLLQTACEKSENINSNTSSDSSTSTISKTPTEALITEPPTEQTSVQSRLQSDTSHSSNRKEETVVFLKPYDDIRALFDEEKIYKENEYNPDDILTFTFNEGTFLLGNEKLQDEIMNNGKNPGLGIRKLHEEGITGKGINVAIIDQNLLLHHPEFDGKIAEYYDTGCM